ncbi:FHA domain-containing protein [Actinoplanes sp. NPDC000266]
MSFAWGTVAVRAGRPLVVGRENSPIAGHLAEYTNVGRRHAEVRSDGRALTVVDLDSMNGTFVNGERLAPNEETPVRAGDKIRFAARLEATVTGGAS